MNLAAFALVIAAACLHALWNLAAKRVADNLGVLWLGLCLAGVALAPLALYDASRWFDPAGLPYLAATGVIHAGYFGLLAAGYRECREAWTKHRRTSLGVGLGSTGTPPPATSSPRGSFPSPSPWPSAWRC
jgi:hypothetical protein